MPEMTSGTALRQLQQAQAGMKKARQALRLAKGDPRAASHVLKLGWESLAQAHRLAAAIPVSAANEPVMTKQLAVQRYATALLVRLRRILRQDDTESIGDDEAFGDDDS
jgi:translation elongation factor EF-Ts